MSIIDIRTITIDKINTTVYNPRADLQPEDPEYEKLKRSIEQFGYIDPIIRNERTGNMVGRHQCYKIMVNEKGHTELAVSVVDLDDQQEKLLNIALNKVSGRWDDEALARLLDDLQVNGADLDLTRTKLKDLSKNSRSCLMINWVTLRTVNWTYLILMSLGLIVNVQGAGLYLIERKYHEPSSMGLEAV
ncbi:transcriptional regulator [Paenibacillus sp. IHBB 10380]|uniref:transcriptional regulator n=1 Tax=Paenibacillus sp. IHBB 10380 TaxID=1566358 RepID=UPI000B15ACC5|nr:transcriptional regulator [Paenibacillus sp. IHBB 10380]